MFIQTQDTPNPQTMKFVPGVKVLDFGTMSFHKGDDLSKAPLAATLFNVKDVEGIFLAKDFITVTKNPNSSWSTLKTLVLAAIMDHFVAGYPVVINSGNATSEDEKKSDEESDPLVRQIKEIINTRVRPAVAEDGGDIVFHDFVDGIVYLQMHGACSGCPSSTVTLKSGIENMLKHFVPEVKEVQAV